jgi:hypothetical protein
MPKTIFELADEKRARITKDKSEAGQNVQLAVAAIIGGIKSPAWRSYMMQFIDQNVPGVPVEPAQLERLMATDGTLGDVVLDRRRAYMVANAVCGSETQFTTTFTIETIDNTLPNVGLVEAEPRSFPNLGGRKAPWSRQKAAKKAAKKGVKKGAKKR